MPVEILKRDGQVKTPIASKAVEKKPIPQSQSQDEGLLGYLSRNIGGTIESLANIPGAIQRFAPGRGAVESFEEFRNLPQEQTIAEQIPELFKQAVGRPEGFGEPRNYGETALRFALSELPLLAATRGRSAFSGPSQFLKAAGESAITRVGSQVGQEAGGVIGEALGNREKGELVGALTGGFGTSTLAKAAKIRPGKLRKELRPKMENLYKEAEEEVTKLKPQSADKINEFVTKEIDNLPNSGLEKAQRNIAKNELLDIEKNFQKKLIDKENGIYDRIINPKAIWDKKKHINGLIKTELEKSEPNTNLVNLYKRTVGNLNESLQDAATNNPSFGDKFLAAEDIYKGLDAPNRIRKVLEEATRLENIIGKNPAVKIIAALGSKWAVGIPYTATIAAAPFAARYGARAYDLFNKSKTAQALAQKIAYDIANDKIHSAINSTIKLANTINKEEKKHPRKKGGVEILKRGNDQSVAPERNA